MMRWLALGIGALSTACSFDWDLYDPRGAGGTTSTSASAGGFGEGGAGATGAGGTATSSSAGGMGGCAPLVGGAPAMEFGEPVAFSELGSGDDPMLSADMLEIYFNADGGDLFTIWRATRECASDPWGPPEEVSKLDIGLEATTPTLSPDGLTIFVSYALDPILKDFDIYMSTRPNRNTSNWSTPAPVAGVSSLFEDRANWISGDALTLGIDSHRTGSGDLYLASRSSPVAAWSPPLPITELNSLDREYEASPTADGLTVVFGRDLLAGGVLYRATRMSIGDSWSPPQPISELDTTLNESDPWISGDGRVIVFTRHVSGDAQLFQAVR